MSKCTQWAGIFPHLFTPIELCIIDHFGVGSSLQDVVAVAAAGAASLNNNQIGVSSLASGSVGSTGSHAGSSNSGHMGSTSNNCNNLNSTISKDDIAVDVCGEDDSSEMSSSGFPTSTSNHPHEGTPASPLQALSSKCGSGQSPAQTPSPLWLHLAAAAAASAASQKVFHHQQPPRTSPPPPPLRLSASSRTHKTPSAQTLLPVQLQTPP